ncbi:uncharacterized protein METZ01_LOCUS346698, partial [marine metagenome]
MRTFFPFSEDVQEDGTMTDRFDSSQDRFFYDFSLDDVVPPDHLVRRIDAVLDFDWLRIELRPYYSPYWSPFQCIS